jgi:hypothetical protein
MEIPFSLTTIHKNSNKSLRHIQNAFLNSKETIETDADRDDTNKKENRSRPATTTQRAFHKHPLSSSP